MTSYSEWSPGLALCQVTLPDRTTVMKETYGAGWKRGLTTQSEVYALQSPGAALPATPVKQTVTDWAQDDQLVSFAENPRVVETNVYDAAGNRRWTTAEYLTPAESPFRPPKAVREYQSDATTVWRRTEIKYRTDSIAAGGAYTNLRVIGLVSEQLLHGLKPGTQAEELLSKATYAYDEGGVYLVGTRDASGSPVTPTQHDPAYGTAYVRGRGLLTSVRRWDVESPTDQAKSVESKAGYNVAGAVVFTTDPLGHKTTVEYADRFSDGVSRNTFAYPTAAADPDQSVLPSPKRAETTYDFDRGLMTKTKDLRDAEQTFTYDAANRLKEAQTLFNGAQTRFEYPADMGYAHTYFKVDAGKPEAHSWRVLDGVGRAIGAASDHPGSAGGYSAQETYYDVMGRAFKQSNPTEVDGAWEPAGDDGPAPAGSGGWRYTVQTFDWQGRPLRVTNADGLTFKDFLYKGCGCAGGQVVVARDEVGRRQKTISDILGRVTTAQDLTPQPDKAVAVADATGPGEVYRTSTTVYNLRDQAVEVATHARAGEADQSKIQKTTSTYDGHGRLLSHKRPERSRAVIYQYNDDDTLWKVFTPREPAGGSAQSVTATFSYNNRHLLRRVEYAVPPALADPAAAGHVPAVTATELSYDAAGNRIAMTDGLGVVSYEYDSLSRLTSETRQFTGVPGSYQFTYGYNLANELTSVRDPFNAQAGYKYDSAGRLEEVTGSGFGNVTRYASEMRYRAWGVLKHLKYGNERNLDLTFDTKLQVTSYKVSSRFNQSDLARLNYQYHEDGRLSTARHPSASKFDRAYAYDHLGRLVSATSGIEAGGGGASVNDSPYRQTYGYDVWDHITSRTGRHWSKAIPAHSATFVNNRRTGYEYDANGAPTRQDTQRYVYDAAENLVRVTDTKSRQTGSMGLTLSYQYDGNGRRVRESKNNSTGVTYHLYSTVLGKAVVEMEVAGQQVQKRKGYVYARGALLAEQNMFLGVSFYEHHEPSNTQRYTSYDHPDGTVAWGATELDPFGNDVGASDPYLADRDADGAGDGPANANYPRFGDPTDFSNGCTVDGIPTTCTFISMFFMSGGRRIKEVTTSSAGGAVAAPQVAEIWEDYFVAPDEAGDGRNPDGTTDYDGGVTGTRLVGLLLAGGGASTTSVTMRATHPAPQNPVQPFDIPGIRSELQRLLSEGCMNFIKDLLGRVASDNNPLVEGGDILKIFDRISQGGGLVRSGGPGSVPGANFALGSFAGGNARIQIGNYLPGGTVTAEELRSGYNRSDAGVGLHESIHHAGRNKYYDEALARAVNARTGAPIQDSRGRRPTGAPRTDPYIYSQYWDAELKRHCK